MESEILKVAMSQGIWAVLSIFLIIYTLKTQEKRDIANNKREKNYQITITKLSDKISDLANIIKDLKEHINQNN